ncbi:SDR family NAD(P)-dependent oxidoreductase [Cellvibrio polysaccharolyticus]|uniref:SDR family NAD(P)-dependent oxidoreductase n=1 Tax=Cellvibrio polysaccharolyticus TaxID=2082724 RepID=A0A928V3X3_9GAMM|nr:SDR family oxidoreductase [Cellvibrio polysaccharolyticus]MBE8717817.1 SDR family NAD(P)-dependent oxidoreductase [Cellvibrio polysaccharolyticus]
MSNKIALITGGSRGLGKNAALALARAGHDLVITYQSKADEAAAVVAEIKDMGQQAVALQLDTAQVAGFADFKGRLQQQLGILWQRDRFDYLVNNAGTGIHTSFTETTEQQFDAMLNQHVKGVFFLTQTLLPLINNGGSILNVSSGLARFSVAGYAAYGTMKGAVEVLTRYLALELGERKIRVNVLAPGAIETDFGGGAVRDNAELNKTFAAGTALGRVGLPDDIGNAVVALLSEQTGWINGQRIEASGGFRL